MSAGKIVENCTDEIKIILTKKKTKTDPTE